MQKPKGFTYPEGSWLPPELIDLLPELSMAQLKVLLIVIYKNTQVGGSAPTPIRDLRLLTGLSMQAVSSALKQLRERGLITRHKIGDTYTYDPHIKLVEHQVKLVNPSCYLCQISASFINLTLKTHILWRFLRIQASNR